MSSFAFRLAAAIRVMRGEPFLLQSGAVMTASETPVMRLRLSVAATEYALAELAMHDERVRDAPMHDPRVIARLKELKSRRDVFREAVTEAKRDNPEAVRSC